MNEHQGEIFFAKWSPSKKILATGGAGDCFVDVWDFNLINSSALGNLPGSTQAPWMQLRHISVANEAQIPNRADESHFISSI
jgi:WD40 repeat protein